MKVIIFAAGKSRLALAAAAGFMMIQVSEPAGAQSASLERCQRLAEFFSQEPAFFTVDQLGNLLSCVADYRAQRGGVAGETGSSEMGAGGLDAGGFSGGTPTFKVVPNKVVPKISPRQLNLPKLLKE